MSDDFEYGKLKIGNKFLIIFFILVVLAILMATGKFDPLEFIYTVFDWISIAVKKIGQIK